MTTATYTLVLCDPDGSLIASVGAAPMLPRFLHVNAAAIALSDEAHPGDGFVDATTYARIASSVWADDERSALFCRVE